jgi:multidrug transporter EmrE-like cation transporter
MSRAFIFSAMAALMYSAGAIFMKASNGLRVTKFALLLYVCFGLGATLQAISLKTADVGSSNTVVLGIEAIGAFVLSIIVFREEVTTTKLAAIGLVGMGVALLRG